MAEPTFIHSTCPHDCPSACALEIEKLSPTRIGKVRGAHSHSYTNGVICAKVARYRERVHHPDRLMEPLRRVGGKGLGRDAFEPISWNDALDEVALAFQNATASDGPEAVWPYFYAGTMGLLQRDGIHRLTHAMGYSRQHSTICATLGDAGWRAGVGVLRGTDAREMAASDLIVVWGGNPVSTQVNVMSQIARARKERGAKLVVIDPYRTGTAAVADMHLALKPGTDGALAAAVMHIMFRDNVADSAYMADFADDPVALKNHLLAKTPEWASSVTGLRIGEIEAFAALYGKTPRAFLRLGYGFTRSRNGAANMHAVTCLATVGGKWRHKGGGALFSNFDLYPVDMSLITGTDLRDRSVRKLDQSRLGAILAGNVADLSGGAAVKAMLVQNTNPMVVCPDLGAVHAGFARDDLFVCVHEQFMTETAAMADIVLPATTFLEHDDLYVGGGHSFLSLGRQVLEPVGQTRSNHEVLCGLAKRLGASHRGFQMSAWDILNETLLLSGLPNAADLFERKWIDLAPDADAGRFKSGFGHPDGRFHFKADWSAFGGSSTGMPQMPDHMGSLECADARHPFRLVAPPA